MHAMMATTGRVAAPVVMRRLAPCAGVASRVLVVRASSSSSGAASSAASSPRPSWDIRLLYDGECPLCLKEVDFLRSKNQANKVVFVDIASPNYDPEENAGVSFDRAMETIHGITAEGRVMTGVEVFRSVYEAVGLGWVYAITKIPIVLAIANKVYDVWASNRTTLTGREALSVILERRRLEAAGKASCRTPQGAAAGQGGSGGQCD